MIFKYQNIGQCPIIEERVFDYTRVFGRVSSNIAINFDVISDCKIPNGSKIDIKKVYFKYEVYKAHKEILVNGHNIKYQNCTGNKILLSPNYINLLNNECNNLIINVIEKLCFSLKVKVIIQGVAYKDGCKAIHFEAIGKGKDEINSSIISNVCFPNYDYKSNKGYIKLENNIIGVVEPNNVFLSPIYNCDCNIESFLGNIFINYCISLDLISLIEEKMNVFTWKK